MDEEICVSPEEGTELEEICEEDCPDTSVPEEVPAPLPDENERNDLLSRIAYLERQLEENERNSTEKKELRELFPDADPENLPDSVAEQYKNGVPLAAAYALYEHIKKVERMRAEEQSRKNARLFHGELGNNTQSTYYTADEVRAMSRDQVKSNFSSIIDSMRHW